MLKKFQVVVLVDAPMKMCLQVNEFCHANGIRFLMCQSRGVFGNIFTGQIEPSTASTDTKATSPKPYSLSLEIFSLVILVLDHI